MTSRSDQDVPRRTTGGATGRDRPAGAAPEAEAQAEASEGALSELATALRDDDRRLTARARSAPSPVADPRHSSRAVDATIAALSAHMSVAEAILYPAARRGLPDGERRTGELYARNHEIVWVLREIEQVLYGDARGPRESFEDLVTALDQTTRRLAEDSDRLVVDLEAALGPERSARLAEDLRAALRHAPTRPHPHLPRSGPLARVAKRVAGWWDHALDVMDAREGAGVQVREPAPPGLWGWYLLGRATTPPGTGSAEGRTRIQTSIQRETGSPGSHGETGSQGAAGDGARSDRPRRGRSGQAGPD
jgi:hypothetical protein